MMNDRMQAIGRGEFDPVTGEFAAILGPDGQPLRWARDLAAVASVLAGAAGRTRWSGRSWGPGGRGGPGGRLGGRGVQQRLYTFTANYTFGGSVLDSAPYQLRPDTDTSKRPYNRQNFGGTIGGPVKTPGVYNGTRRTNFQFCYSGNRGDNLFDQYATVPTDAMRTAISRRSRRR